VFISAAHLCPKAAEWEVEGGGLGSAQPYLQPEVLLDGDGVVGAAWAEAKHTEVDGKVWGTKGRVRARARAGTGWRGSRRATQRA
jgi:hypothetical protein